MSSSVLDRLEELDILLLDHIGNPIAFTEKFSLYIDSFYVEPETELQKYSNGILRDIVINYCEGKLRPKENIKLYCKIILQILEYICDTARSCDEFRRDVLERLHL